MGRDPAFLFYVDNWIGGTLTFTREQKGAYMDLLMAQFNIGHLPFQDIKDVLKDDFEKMWESKLTYKFVQDENNLYFNERLDLEMGKRKKYKENQSKHGKKGIKTKKEKGIFPYKNQTTL